LRPSGASYASIRATVLLAVDVGNTQTHLGAFDGETLVEHWRLATEPSATADELGVAISSLLALKGIELGRVDASIVSTVVPQLGPEYAAMCERHIRSPYLMVGPSLKTGMAIKIDNPHELGADRLVNAVAAYEQAGGPCVAVDFGTSTNFDVVSAAGEYLGGAIAPGVEISMEALTERTAKLPRIDLTEPASAIGRNTQATMQSGVVFGFAGLVDGISERLAAELDGEATFIATGGLASVIAPFCGMIDEVDDLLTLTGLRLIHERNA
jgi:type III pantothenate kinase